MINPSIMALKIELSNSKKEFNEKELKMKRFFWELQTFANPYYKSIGEIKTEEILQCAKDMKQTKLELIELERKINSIKSNLGETND